jgi:hypothetical protein
MILSRMSKTIVDEQLRRAKFFLYQNCLCALLDDMLRF